MTTLLSSADAVQSAPADTLDADLYALGRASGLAGEGYHGLTSPRCWYAGYQAGVATRQVLASLRRSRERRGLRDDTLPTAADRAWVAAQNTGGTTADDDERRAVELTVSALDWTLEAIPDADWDRWAEERQQEDAA